LLDALGVPNYFGEQRFGRDGSNVERARQWICSRRPRASIGAFERGLHLSTARALLFNAVLGARVAAGTWSTPIDGDVALDGSPTGPLWGRGRPGASGRTLEVEREVLCAYRDWLDPLEHLGLRQERRTLVARPRRMAHAVVGDDVELSFELAAGQYATVLLREIGAFRVAAAEVA
jgi:tRNA pseudouridine13 synthase